MAVDNYALGQRDGAIASARAWEEYAHKLEQAILDLRRGEAGRNALIKAMVSDLKPNSPLMQQPNRQKVFNAGYSNAVVTVSGK